MYGIIYKITNIVTNKYYIGKTTKTAEKRFKEHIFLAEQGASYKLSNSIRKHGANNFKVEKIDSADTNEELSEKEKYWISYYNSYNDGYNMTLGGEGGDTYSNRTPEDMEITKKKISVKAHEHNSNHGQYVGDVNSMWGKHHTEHAKKMMSEKLTGRKKPAGHGEKVSKATKGVKKNYIPSVVKLYVIDINTNESVRLSAGDIVNKYNIGSNTELKSIVDNNKLVDNRYLISKSVSTIPDECKEVGLEISTNPKRTTI